ncbi:hypothetical protein FOZ63_013546, partial [Perkinsus olseni]
GGKKGINDNYHMVHTDPRPKVAIVSSEPLNTIHDEWTPVPHNHTLVLITSPNTDTVTVLLAPLECTSYPKGVVSTKQRITSRKDTADNVDDNTNKISSSSSFGLGASYQHTSRPVHDAGPSNLRHIIASLTTQNGYDEMLDDYDARQPVTSNSVHDTSSTTTPLHIGLDDPLMEIKASSSSSYVVRGRHLCSPSSHAALPTADIIASPLNNTICS